MRREDSGGPFERRVRVFRSLRFRMALSHGGVLALIVLVLGGTGYALLSRTLIGDASASILAVAQATADRVAETGPTAPSDVDLPSAATVRVAVVAPDGTIIAERTAVPSWLRPQPTKLRTVHTFGEDVRLATIHVRSHGVEIATVVAVRSLSPEEQLLHRLRLLLVVGGLAAVAASMGAGWLLAGRALRPVRSAYEAQASFAADASHELRTPLAFVRSGVEVLAEGEPELGDQVLGEIDYLTGLTDRLLTLARAQSRELAVDLRPLRLAPLCESAANRNRQVHRLSLEIRGDGDPSVMADAVAAGAALDAVLENVAGHGGGSAVISWADADGEVVVSVADRGPGLPVADRERAFERFFRADPARGREQGSSGLGLALARTLVEAQGGRMWLKETPGGGLTALMSLRAAPPPA